MDVDVDASIIENKTSKHMHADKEETRNNVMKKQRRSSDTVIQELNCPICLTEKDDTTMLNECKHVFCYTCIIEWLKMKPECPLCERLPKQFKHKFQYNAGEKLTWETSGQIEDVADLRAAVEMESILAISSYTADVDRHVAVQTPRLVSAVNFLCSDLCSADFFIDTLISHFTKSDDALAIFVTRSHRASMRKVCERVTSILSTLEQDRSDLRERMLLLMALCSHSSLRLSPEECHQWAYYLTHQPTTRTVGAANTHKMTLAVILACPSITPNQPAFRDEQVENYLIDYFQGLRELAFSSSTPATASEGANDNDSLGRMMLLVAIHMSTNKGDELATLVSSVLGFKVNETLRKLFTVKTLYLRHAVTERDIAEKAARLGVTRALNATSSGYLPVHCINHLLSSRTFSKHHIPVQVFSISINELLSTFTQIMNALLDELLRLEEVGHPNLDFFAVFEFCAASTGTDGSRMAQNLGYLADEALSWNNVVDTFCLHLDVSFTRQWIKSQMLECTAPVHPIMTNLLKNFSSSCVPTPEHEHFNAAIEEEFFWEIFSEDIFDRRRTSTVVQLLALFYLIAYTYKLETTFIGVVTTTPSGSATLGDIGDNEQSRRTQHQPQPYSARLWARIPIRYLLLVLDARHEDYAAFRPVMLRFIAASMPHMLPNINSTLHNIDVQVAKYNDPKFTHTEHGSISTESFRNALLDFTKVLRQASFDKGTLSSPFMCALSRVDRAPIIEQYRHWPTIVDAMEVTLLPTTPRYVTDTVVRVWQRLENLIPRCLYEKTLQKWLFGEHAAISGVNGRAKLIQVDNELLLAETPLILFRVDDRVFRSPPHLRCLMHMLSFYLEASKNVNNLRLLKASTVTHSKVELDEKAQLYKSLIGAQYLTVVQILLELCDGDDLLPQSSPLHSSAPCDELAEIREVCCAQIHQMFIADSLLPKLVHFNTYPLHLIPVMVRGVPSAHVLISFLGDLLAGANLERRIFGICLMSELIEKYKIPMAFAGVGFISDVLDTLLSCTIDEEHIVLFLHVTQAIVRLAKVSPFHAAALIETMQRMRKIVHARMALYASVVTANESPERRLADALDHALAESQGSSCTISSTTSGNGDMQKVAEHEWE